MVSVGNSILDRSKLEAGSHHLPFEPVGLADGRHWCSAMLEPQAKARDITRTTGIPVGIGEVAGDQRAVQRIVVNLWRNAIKSTPEGRRGAIEAGRHNQTIRLSISDTGSGVGADDLDRIGQPFVQVR